MKHFRGIAFLGILTAIVAAAQPQLPPPTINSLFPNAVVAGSPGFTMTVDGTRFTQGSRVVWRPGAIGSANLATTFLSETRLSAVVPASLLELPGNVAVVVTQPGDPGTTLTSGEATFSVVAGMTVATPCPLANAIVTRPYEVQFVPSGGLAPYLWSLTSGSLPQGLAFTPGGIVRGTPTAAGEASFTVRVTDSQNNSASKACSLRVVAGTEGQSLFITQIEPAGVLGGSLPTAIRIRGDGFSSSAVVVWNSGTAGAVDLPTRWDGDQRFLTATIPQNLLAVPGTFPIAVRSVVLTRQTFSNVENFLVAAPLQVTNSCPLSDAVLRGNYTGQLTASGGFTPYTWAIPSGSLPPGISLRPAGELAGQATEAGGYDLALTVTDSRGNTATRACSLRVLGPLTAAPAAMTFAADAQGVPPPSQWVAVSGSASGLAFSAFASVETGFSWLRVSSDTTRMPALVRVSVDPGGLGPGVYRGSVNVSSDASTNRNIQTPVTLVIGNVRGPEIAARPLALRWAAGRGSGRLQWQSVQLSNPSSQLLEFSTNTAASWLTVTSDRATVRNNQSAMLRVRASAEGLAPGTYRGAVQVLSAGRPTLTIPVTLSVSLAPEALLTAQSGMSFVAVQGGPAPSAKSVHALSNGVSGYFWEASPSTAGNRTFISINPPSNASRPGQPSGSEVRADPESLGPDLYFGDVRINSSNTDNSPRLISTVLQVLPAQAVPPAELSFSGLVLTAPAGGATSIAQGSSIRNIARAPILVDYQLAGDARIFSSTVSGTRTLGPGESRRVEVQANVTTVGVGVHRAVLYVQSSGDPQVRAVNVTLVSTPAAGGRCTPTALVATPLSLGDGFQVNGGLPAALEFHLLDDCGEPVNSGIFTVIPSTNSGVAHLSAVGGGRWAGTWPVLQNTASAVSLAFVAEDPDRNLQTSGTVSGSVVATNVPIIAEDATVSAASLGRGAPLSPGSLFSIFGGQLAEGRNSPAALPLPFSLGQTRVQVGDREIPLFFAGDQGSFSQVNAVMPYGAPLNTLQQVAVWRGTRRSPYVDVTIAPAQPAIFTVSQSGGGQGIVVDGENPTILADAVNPVGRGKVAVIYCEGLGAVVPPVIAGQAAPASPPAAVQNAVAVTIGGLDARVLFAGLTPGLTGLYQINVVVPEAVTPGPAVPVIVTSGGLSSEPAAIGVR